MRWMTQRFPDLITPDTNVKLTFTEERYGQVSECYGPFSYRQFIQAMGSEEEIAKIHEYIVKSYMPTLKPDMRHETLPAEDKLLLSRAYDVIGLAERTRSPRSAALNAKFSASSLLPLP